MKHINQFILVCAVCFPGFMAEISRGSEWEWLNPQPSGVSITDVWGSSSDRLYVTGRSRVWRWSNGTIAPVAEAPVSTRILWGIHGTSPDSIMAVGQAGTVLYWDGEVWSDLSGSSNTELYDVWSAATGEYFIAGSSGTVWMYDGESTWSSIQLTSMMDFYSIWGMSASDVYVTGYAGGPGVEDTVYRWNGDAWNPMPQDTTGWTMDVIWGFGTDDFWVAGEEGQIHRWNGASWEYHDPGFSFAATLKGAWGVSSQDMYFAGQGERILHFDGSNWTYVQLGGSGDFSCMAGFAANDLVAMGSYGLAAAWDGEGWRTERSGAMDHLSGIWCSAGDTAFAVGYSGIILRRTGSGWTEEPGITAADLHQIWGDGVTAVAVGDGGTVLFWDGVEWHVEDAGTTADLYCVRGLPEGPVFAAGAEGTVIRRENGGWSEISGYGSPVDLYGVWPASGTSVYFAGDRLDGYGAVLHWSSGTWTLISHEGVYGMNDIFGFSPDDIYAVGGGGQILHFNGTEWSLSHPEALTGATLNRIWGPRPGVMAAAGTGGDLFVLSEDSWQFCPTGCMASLQGLGGGPQGEMMVCGEHGAILETTGPLPDCTDTGVSLTLPAEQFVQGDVFYCHVSVCNGSGDSLTGYPLFVILDVYGHYFFGPGFTPELDSYLHDYPVFESGRTLVEVFSPFAWPQHAGEASGIRLLAALTDPEITVIYGQMDSVTFGWSE